MSLRLRRIAAPCLFVVLSLLAPAAGGQASATATMVVTPPTLDGRTDDPAWASAQVIDQFLEYDPNEGVKWSYWINP